MPFKKGHRGHARKSTRISLGATRTSTPRNLEDDEDEEEMVDVDDTRDATPQEEREEEDEAVTPQAQDDDEEEGSTPPTITTIPRRRGRGGRARTRVTYTHTPEPGGDDGSESGTPARRRRGRPPGSTTTPGRGRGGFRGRRKGQVVDSPKVVIDKDGTTLDVVDDEAIVDDDEEGNEKVDAAGNLLGGREYRVRTFTILGRADRLYMLSTEPARCCGFRDSYLFFTKHPKLYKVLIGEEEKRDLIDRDVLPNSYKGRNIGVVTARSVFREFGARIVVGGRKVTDDYKVAQARENGEIEGELADPDDHVPDQRADYNRNRYVAWFGASEVYRSQAGSNLPTGKPGPIGKRRTNITLANWQTMHAKEASLFNSSLSAVRRSTLGGVYDTHTNMMVYPTITQPTHAKWEYILPAPAADHTATKPKILTNGHALPNGTSQHESAMDLDGPPSTNGTPATSTIFQPVSRSIARNFTVVDTVYSAPPLSHAGFPGPDGALTDATAGPNGLDSIPLDVLDELPDACRAAFDEARTAELQWKRQWATEAHSGRRGALKIGFHGYPV